MRDAHGGGCSRRSSLVPALNSVISVCTQLSPCVCCQARLLLCHILDHFEGEKTLPSAAVCLTASVVSLYLKIYSILVVTGLDAVLGQDMGQELGGGH